MAKKKPSETAPGRLVWNHSTHIPGLIPVLTRLCNVPGVKTVTPGRLAQAKGRPTPLTIRVTVPIVGGFKLQARSSGSVQEIFVVTSLTESALQQAIDQLLADT
ncbi:MAG: DUF2103 domain-containing protein [Chloracidobacterium sp.]|uniref:DUF2103 domain-containing protein n=1 Tax=Chloracidobacterium validum TaxID=2821543 RepID=A0ABX8BGM0_9BACT|nr:DUF2103 domain-containing protein [Chloracidobacterium validum]QUW04230.1 DUF2103 domain-containing protein [Chloracidobacterium validum]